MAAIINIKIPKPVVNTEKELPNNTKVPDWFKKLHETVSRIETKLKCYQNVTRKSAAKLSVSKKEQKFEREICYKCGGHGHKSMECPSK